MAKCDLSIDLDDPDKVYVGGDKITGTVHVIADADVHCKGLEVQSTWRTHGRGNIAQGNHDTVTVFQGEWSAGQRESYRFELRVPYWPPSYHGNYINLDHYVDARAKIPWAFDPKASAEYMMRPTDAPPADQIATKNQANGCVGFGLLGLVGAIMLFGCGGAFVALVANPFVAVFIGLFLVPIAAFLTARYLLPKWLLGNVTCELKDTQLSPGDTLRARLEFEPRRGTAINSISATLTGSEVCVSGSGSNRTTHRNVFFEERHQLEGATTLQAGQAKQFDLALPIPADVPYSFDLNDNDLNWELELRVDIPRWPDWHQKLKFQVVPDGSRPKTESPAPHAMPDAQATAATPDDEITFVETASHLWQLRDDGEQVNVLVDAVTGLTFDMEAIVERRLLYSGSEDPHVYRDGYAVWAHHTDPPLPLVLYVPHELADEFEQAGREPWRFRGTIVGWDDDHRRLQIKVLTH
ncbi:sporulation protein [Roseiconus nitratireducens]|nr:sporulation protein [Roseiconus nitratireducens]